MFLSFIGRFRWVCAISAICLSLVAARADNIFLFPVFISDINDFNAQNFVTAQAYDPTVPLNVERTVSPVPNPPPNQFSLPDQGYTVQALPGGQGGSMNEFGISPAGFHLVTNQTAVTDDFNLGSASVRGMLTFGTSGVSFPYAVNNSFVYQAAPSDPDHPDRWESFVTLTDLTSNSILYNETDSADTINTFGNQYGMLPANHVFRLDFRSHTDSNQLKGTAFGNGVMDLALGAAAVPEPASMALVGIAGALLLRRHRGQV